MLYALRRQEGVTQSQLAQHLNVPQCQISKLENGEVDLRLSTLLKLAVVFKSSLKDWMPDAIDLAEFAVQAESTMVERAGPGLLKQN